MRFERKIVFSLKLNLHVSDFRIEEDIYSHSCDEKK